MPNFTSEITFTKCTFRYLLFGHESIYLVAVLLCVYNCESAHHEHKSLRDTKFRMIFQEKLWKIHHLLPHPSYCCLVSKQSRPLEIGGALTPYSGISDNLCRTDMLTRREQVSLPFKNIYIFFFSFFLNLTIEIVGIIWKFGHENIIQS